MKISYGELKGVSVRTTTPNSQQSSKKTFDGMK